MFTDTDYQATPLLRRPEHDAEAKDTEPATGRYPYNEELTASPWIGLHYRNEHG
ncbi:hypothetical protein [Arthrobacter sp. AZCC_0090]|uniref:hypothetical protein n=1 Tax=Arthrobacter sp. AZCC_0090 TaxID=2735881 RepID=UPI001613FD33|nr:hypothetical protein [Arthrobacter sp. AZCC_0090]MBB6406382.1 hypothetical protein [Arthrobacter sp. AZCC_0090]